MHTTGTTARIKRHISRLPGGALFTTRDLLAYGLRNAVDQAMRRLLKAQWCIRLARGVFQKTSGIRLRAVTALEVAQVKAKAFGRRIIDHAEQVARRLGLLTADSECLAFATDGRSSSFKFGDVTILLIGTSPRKLKLGQGRLADSLQALWHLGKTACDSAAILSVSHKWSHRERDRLAGVAGLIPGWLRDQLSIRIPIQHWNPRKKAAATKLLPPVHG